MNREMVIVGGGLAGLSAAVEALRSGWHPILLEKSSCLGGRTRSLFIKDIQCWIDNGQHVLASNYQATRNFLKHIGSIHRVDFSKALKICLKFPDHKKTYLKTWLCFPPLHFALPLFFHTEFNSRDRKALWHFFRKFYQITPQQLSEMTVHQWMRLTSQNEFLIKSLWEPLTVATLNTPIDQASALLLHTVLRQAFLASPTHSGLGLPKTLLNDIFARPAEEFIVKHGGRIYLNTTVNRLIVKGSRVTAIETNNRPKLDTPALILALPPHALSKLLSHSKYPDSELIRQSSEFKYAPIITINIWLKSPLEIHYPTALVDCPIHWIFKHPFPGYEHRTHGYSLVISAGFRQAEMNRDSLLALVDQELKRFFGKSLFQDYGVAAYKIIKEKRATILQSPDSIPLRPPCKTALVNLSLAGDWINTGLPATIESGILSGKMAIKQLDQGE